MKVSIRIFDREESEFLTILIEQAAKRLNLPVSYTEVSAADVVFLKEDEPGTDILLRSTQNAARPIAVLYGQGAHPWKLERPATSKNLMPLLTQLSERLAANPAQTPAAPATPAKSAPQILPITSERAPSPSALLPVAQGPGVLEKLSNVIALRQNLRITLTADEVLYLEGARGLALAPAALAQDKATLAQRILQAPVQAFAASSGAPDADDSLQSMTLEELLWKIGQTAQPVTPLPIGAGSRRFRLTRWPTFSRIDHDADLIGLSGRLIRSPASLDQLAAGDPAALDRLARFFNSAYLCGLLKVDELRAAEPAPIILFPEKNAERMEKAGVFQRILKRLVG